MPVLRALPGTLDCARAARAARARSVRLADQDGDHGRGDPVASRIGRDRDWGVHAGGGGAGGGGLGGAAPEEAGGFDEGDFRGVARERWFRRVDALWVRGRYWLRRFR